MRFVMPFSHDPHTRGFSQNYRVSVHTISRFIPNTVSDNELGKPQYIRRRTLGETWLPTELTKPPTYLGCHRPIRESKYSDNAALLPNSYPTEEQFRLSKCDHLCFTHRLSHTHPRNPSAN